MRLPGGPYSYQPQPITLAYYAEQIKRGIIDCMDFNDLTAFNTFYGFIEHFLPDRFNLQLLSTRNQSSRNKIEEAISYLSQQLTLSSNDVFLYGYPTWVTGPLFPILFEDRERARNKAIATDKLITDTRLIDPGLLEGDPATYYENFHQKMMSVDQLAYVKFMNSLGGMENVLDKSPTTKKKKFWFSTT